ncbi:glycosyltransferase WbuB [Thiosulfativibrio zosterae]|uniref:Glycosyltransferase WbuB n=1 Tax=Thiosulfativibrio zosterae TaxID=2675053 RepID=A0A6F8PQT5_9GAMM|nr:glycosyltransferase WbuB [Thiosulfativibrio zosterae]BBP44492.1 glycosyltransferase WbuB [Thiosulfativibrio zosterae]
MKILLISTNYSPELTGIGKYSGEMTEWLAKHGHDVRVICAPPYYPEWKVSEDYSAWKYQKQSSENLTVYRCPIWVPAKPSGLKRLLHLASFALTSLPVVLRHIFWRADVIICVEPPLFNSFGAILTSKLSGAKSILHIQDFEVDAAFELGIVKANWLKRFIYGVERFLMRRFDKVSTISEAMLKKLDEKDIAKDKQLFFPNWVDTSFIHPLSTVSEYRSELNIPLDKPVVLYSGNMGEKQGLEIVIEAAKNLANDNIQFIMCGSGAALDRLQTLAKGLDNILWLPLQPFERLNEFLNLADIHLLPQQAGAADLVMPSKLTGILSSGRPVVATAQQGTQVACVVEGKGMVVAPADSEAFSAAIKTLANNPKLRNELGINARTYAENNLEYNSIMSNLETELKLLAR